MGEDLVVTDALVQLSFLVQSVFEQACAEHDTPPAQARLLGVLEGRSPGMAELAGLLGVERASVTGLVDRAERRGLARRVAVPGDRRASRVELTGQGRQVEAAFRTTVTDRLGALVADLPRSDHAHLTRMAARILAAGAAR
ncbi:MarR family winged helix-turn-helix transcriptional regulator [Streptantibioticus ferralitis]|uniref:MarR family transcriptional regulator n=1 Tax=Streptantibioticus ferralitis TaxID=236510 RepID=A0ABT5ZBS5_9ACTN|nr:MarR family transcriptional regulator [Streptantibioticus ferralitis]MDF2261290.1 MarR family transcriptional regulator [Streptantibioticus ferralitis]